MAEERSGAQPLEEGRGQQGRTASRGQQSRRQRSVFQYVAILFAAALVLLFYTYMMEQRQFEQLQRENQENIDDLRQSVSAVQTLQGMTEENKLLKEQNQELEARLQALEERSGPPAGTEELASVDVLFGDVSDSEDFRLLKRIALDRCTVLEVAEDLGISVESCKKRVQRARKRLQGKMTME